MPKSLEKILKANMPMLTELIRSKGRNGDTILAHINPKEAALLQAYGGSGGTNPETGLPEFQMDFDIGFGEGVYTPPVEAADISGATFTPEETATYGYTPTTTPVDMTGFRPEPAQQPTGFDISTGQGMGFRPIETSLGYPQAAIEAATLGARGMTPEQIIPQAPAIAKPPEAGKAWYESLGLGKEDVKRLGLGALIAAPLTARNVQQTKRAQQQAAVREAELRTVGEPYQRTGRELQRAAQAGELTPASQRALDVARAQMAQATATRGGVGAEQASAQIAALQNQMLQAQYDLGLKVAQIGDQYVSGAIRTGMQADQMINQANNAFYASLAQMAAPFILGQQPVYAMGGYPTTRGT